MRDFNLFIFKDFTLILDVIEIRTKVEIYSKILKFSFSFFFLNFSDFFELKIINTKIIL